MRALDPLGYEKETLAHFQTLRVSDVLLCFLVRKHGSVLRDDPSFSSFSIGNTGASFSIDE